VELIITTFPLTTRSPDTKYTILVSIDGKGNFGGVTCGLAVSGEADGRGDGSCVGDGGSAGSGAMHGTIEQLEEQK